MQETIAIIGAGLGGLTLACILHRHGVDVTIYEAESSPTARCQGGLLDIHEHSGQAALRAAGLYDAFRRLVRPGEDARRVVNKRGHILFETAPDRASRRPEVDRGELRAMLIAALPGGAIRWNHKVSALARIGDGRHAITCANGTRVIVDLLIGADGAWSKVRRLLSTASPVYAGTCFIEIALAAEDARHAQSVAAIGPGTLMAVAPGKGIIAHRNADGSVAGYAALNVLDAWIGSSDVSNAGASLDAIARHFADWAPYLCNFITNSTVAPVVRPIHALPIGHAWARQAGVTLLGDAAHLMSPFAGEGANLAMYDGADLAQAIIERSGDMEAALAAYEGALFPRSRDAARLSARNLELFFGNTAPQSVVDLFSGLASAREAGCSDIDRPAAVSATVCGGQAR